MGLVLTAAYKMAAEPLYHWTKDYINGEGVSKEETSKEEGVEPQKSQEQAVTSQGGPETPDEKVDLQESPDGKKQKGPDGDSGIVPGNEPNSRNSSRRNSYTSSGSKI